MFRLPWGRRASGDSGACRNTVIFFVFLDIGPAAFPLSDFYEVR